MKNLSHRSSINIPHWALGLLLLLFFYAPAYASDAPATPTFRSTSPFGINQTIQGTTMNNNGIHQGTIYKPFSDEHPTAGFNPSYNLGNGNNDDDDDIGIPGWADTPSEPLPIGDTLPLFLFAAAMIAIIWIRQRKQQRLTTQTQPTNNNDTTQHMTIRKQTYKSLRQKLFLLLVFVCIAGQVSGQSKNDTTLNKKQNAVTATTKTIYFRPSTVCIDGGYSFTGLDRNNDIAWVRRSSPRCYFIVEKTSGGKQNFHGHTKSNSETGILPNTTTGITNKAQVSRFIPATLGTDSKFAFYRAYFCKASLAKKDSLQDCIPNSKWWLSDSYNYGAWDDELISVSELGDRNLVAIQEAYWAGGSGIYKDYKGYYYGYYLENDAHIYFVNNPNWTSPTFLRSKDIYAYTHNLANIPNTKLWYCKLAKPSASDVESGIAYTQYAFISNQTNKVSTSVKGQVAADAGLEDPYLWKRWPHVTVNNQTPDLAYNNRKAHNFGALRSGKDFTAIRTDMLSGYNLFIPGNTDLIPGGSTAEEAPSKTTYNSWESLNHTQTITVKGGGKINYYTFKLRSANSTGDAVDATNKTGTVTFNAAYTATVIVRAIPDKGYDFIGFFEEGSNTSLSYTEDSENPGEYLLYYEAPNAPKNITAVFSDSKAIRMQLLNDALQWTNWDDTPNGNTLKVAYTDIITNTAVTYTFDKPRTENTWVYHNKEYIYINNIDASKNITFTADASQSEYTFIGWWNNDIAYSANPWSLDNPATYNQSVTARFARVKQQTVNVHTYNTTNDTYDALGTVGGNVSITYTKSAIDGVLEKPNDKDGYGNGYKTFTNDVATSGTYASIYNSSVTLTATPNTNYAFLGWYEGENKVGSNTTYTYIATTERNITARFHVPFQQNFIVQTEIGGQYQNSTIGGTATISYNDGTKTAEIGSSTLSIEDMYQGSMNTLTATPNDGYRFVGWYNNSGNLDSSNPTYTYRAERTRTVHARFAPSNITLSVAVLNYNPEYDKFEEYGYEYNTITLKENSRVLEESYSSFKHKFENATTVTLTATPEEGEDGYDFVGWYINNEKLTAKGSNSLYTLASDASTELTLNLSGPVAVNAHFAPKKCWKVTLDANAWGKYTLQYSKDSKFSTFQSIESSYTQPIYTFVPYKAYVKVSSVQPIHGYTCLRYKRGGSTAAIGTPIQCSANNHNIQVELVRDEEQVVYLNLRGANDALGWAPSNDPNKYAYYAYVDNEFYSTDIKRKWIRMEHVNDYCYRCTISPANRFNKVNFVQIYIDANGNPTTKDGTAVDMSQLDGNETYSLVDIRDVYKVQKIRSGATPIPATRNNCYRLNWFWNSSTQKNENAWTTPPTTTGDFRLIYIEQEVASKTEINRTYEFIDGDRIKKIASGTKLDTVSLHIYNKVSKDNNGNLTGTALNNPEIILQQWDGTAWVDVERYMVFGPLKSDNPGVIRMPGRKNTAPVVDLGIDAIKAQKENATKDYGSGVWNFVIEQNGSSARLLPYQTHRYEGTYYIRTPNADGQYNNFTHPGNILSYSEYAKNNSDYSHYFIRYVDIYEDGTPTAEAGKHPVVKFCIANDYAINLCKEFTNTQNRFEPEEDIYVLNAGDLPADATVRFGWDIKTNRLTRAYIASTFKKNNEYLVVEEGENIGAPQGDAQYFTDNSNWLYSIDLPEATAGATAKVKAKMNGQYQYFMGAQPGSQNEYETLISGNGANTYPIRLLYDFKDDRFTTIYHPESGTINNDVALSTPLMIEREHNGQATQIVLNTNKITTVEAGQDQYTQPAYAVMTFLESVLADASKTHHEKMFYWISFPFDVRISDVFGLGDYGKYWIMEEYDGAQRAQSGLAKSNWKYITKKSAVLSKNVGYVLCLNYSQILQDQLFKSYGGSDETLNNGKLSLYFPSNGIVDPKSIVGGQDATIDLAEHYNANTAWNHHNWHIIGVPSFANPGTIDEQQDAPFVYEYWHPGDAYAAVSINEVKFQSMHAYMVQYAGKITWTNKIVNTGGSVDPKFLAAKKDADADKKVMLRLELQQAGSTLDKTYVQLRNDKGTKGFDMSLDLTKIINAGANIYSIVDNHEMAGNAIPKDETVLPLGVVITSAGDYTFAMPKGTEGIIVELIDYEQGTSTNLLMSDYTITLNKGTFNQRFALRLKPDKVATSVDNIGNGANSDEVRKLFIDGVLYLVKDGAVYDAQGHCVTKFGI